MSVCVAEATGPDFACSLFYLCFFRNKIFFGLCFLRGSKLLLYVVCVCVIVLAFLWFGSMAASGTRKYDSLTRQHA